MHLIFQWSDVQMTYNIQIIIILAHMLCTFDLKILIKTQQQQLNHIHLATTVANKQLICFIYSKIQTKEYGNKLFL